MAKVIIKLEGMQALQRAVTKSPKELKSLSSDAVRQSTWAIANKMRVRVPVRTGTLLTSIEAIVPVQGLSGSVRIHGDAFYWRHLEYGTVKMTARPFARPSAEEESATFVGRFHEVARKLERFWGSQ